MRFLTVSSCLGFDLETGGLILGFFELCATTMFFLSSNNGYSDDEYSFNDACTGEFSFFDEFSRRIKNLSLSTVINFFALFLWFIGIYKASCNAFLN